MKNSAVVVIDLQNGITKNYREIIENVNKAIDWAAQNELWVAYIQHNNLSAGTRTFKPGTRGAELVPELNVVSDHIFAKCKSNAYSVGQAAQPIVSTNFGAGKGARIRETLWLALWTSAFFGVFWTALSMACPNVYVRIFMSPTEEFLRIAPAIIRTYALSFLLLPLNIFSTYYFQAIMQPRAAFIVSVARGLVISGILILLLPALVSASAIWFAMPITELLTAVYAVTAMRRYTAKLQAS